LFLELEKNIQEAKEPFLPEFCGFLMFGGG